MHFLLTRRRNLFKKYQDYFHEIKTIEFLRKSRSNFSPLILFRSNIHIIYTYLYIPGICKETDDFTIPYFSFYSMPCLSFICNSNNIEINVFVVLKIANLFTASFNCAIVTTHHVIGRGYWTLSISGPSTPSPSVQENRTGKGVVCMDKT